MRIGDPVYATARFEEARDYLAGKNLTLNLRQPAAPAERRFDARINALFGDALYLASTEYGVDVSIGAPAERDDYAFSFALNGEMTSTARDETIHCRNGRAVIASPGRPQTVVLSRNTTRATVSISKNAVRRHLSALTGQTVQGRLEFEPSVSLRAGAGGLIAGQIRLITERADSGNGAFANSLMRAHFENMLLSTLLLYHPHTHRGLIEQNMSAPAPADIRRVLDFIHAHLDRPLRLEHLVEVAGVPGRTLNEHFRHFVGIPPMAYVRKVRLETVRDVLGSSGSPSVTHAAFQYGFTHLGRFTDAYKQAFGELPSATRRRNGR